MCPASIGLRTSLAVVLIAYAGRSLGAVDSELTLKSLHFAHSQHEISGLATYAGRTVVVADDAEDAYLFEVIDRGSRRFALVKSLRLAALQGWAGVQAAIKSIEAIPNEDRILDLEGLAVCGTTIYLANERARQVLVVDEGRAIRVAPIDFATVTPSVFAPSANAGFEGIAADCPHHRLYIAKEREPRLIIEIDTETWRITKTSDFEGSDRQGQKVINPWTGQGLYAIGPDIGDLAVDQGFLYALERNTFEVAKLDPKTLKVVERVSYFQSEKGLYETQEPFGLGEALLLTPSEILIGLDNNGTPLSRHARQKFGVKGSVGALLHFARPAGF